MTISIIVAKSLNNVIGKDGKIPWNEPEDMTYFKEATMGSTVIMGRKTWESLPGKLIGRDNIVVCSDPHAYSKICDKKPDLIVSSLELAINAADYENIFIIGGAQLYKEALPLADYLYMSIVKHMVEGDTFFPEWSPNDWRLEHCNSSDSRRVLFKKYRRK